MARSALQHSGEGPPVRCAPKGATLREVAFIVGPSQLQGVVVLERKADSDMNASWMPDEKAIPLDLPCHSP